MLKEMNSLNKACLGILIGMLMVGIIITSTLILAYGYNVVDGLFGGLLLTAVSSSMLSCLVVFFGTLFS